MEISIIITNHNYKRFVGRAIRSALNQSFNKDEYEIIVVDDCSTDGSQEIIKSFGGSIRAIFNDRNVGLAASCNKAISAARSTYFVRLDADDYLAKHHLLMTHAYVSNNKSEMHAVSCDYCEVDANEVQIRRKNGTTWPIACGILFKVDDFWQLGGYSENVPREDVEFRGRFLRSGRQIFNVAVPLYRYTQHKDSMTKDM